MVDKKTEKSTQLSLDDLKTAKSAWKWVVQPLDGGHVRIIGSKAPPGPKKG